MIVGTDTLLGDMPFEGGSQGWKVQVAVDGRNCLPASTRPAAHQRRAMSPFCQFFTLAKWLRQMELTDSMQLVLRSVRARVGDPPRRSTVNVSLKPSRRLPAAPVRVCSNFLASASSWASAKIADGAWTAPRIFFVTAAARPSGSLSAAFRSLWIRKEISWLLSLGLS